MAPESGADVEGQEPASDNKEERPPSANEKHEGEAAEKTVTEENAAEMPATEGEVTAEAPVDAPTDPLAHTPGIMPQEIHQ